MGHIPAQDKLRQLHSLGGHLYMCGPSMHHFEVRPKDLVLDDISIVEYLTFMAAMEGADIQLFVPARTGWSFAPIETGAA